MHGNSLIHLMAAAAERARVGKKVAINLKAIHTVHDFI